MSQLQKQYLWQQKLRHDASRSLTQTITPSSSLDQLSSSPPEMRGLLINSAIAGNKISKPWRLSPTFRESARALNDILLRWRSGHIHVVTPPVFDSKVGFTDYEKERREFSLDVPEYFNFANIIDAWAQKDKVLSCVLKVG